MELLYISSCSYTQYFLQGALSRGKWLLHRICISSVSLTATAKLLQSCPSLCDPTDGSPPSSPVPGILQARTLEWVAISFSNAGKTKVKVKLLSHVWLFAAPWTAAYQASPPMGFSRQEYWSGLPLPSPLIRYTHTHTHTHTHIYMKMKFKGVKPFAQRHTPGEW